MIDITLVNQALTSINTLRTMFSAAVDIRDSIKQAEATNASLSEISDLIGKVISLQIAISESNAAHETITREKRDLEEKLLTAQNQKADFERYALQEIAPGVLAYALVEAHQNGEPPHWICSRCRNEGKKSILQLDKSKSAYSMTCPNCETRHPNGEYARISFDVSR